MALVSYLRNQYLSWSRNTPLPKNLENMWPVFQPWHHFDASHERWTSLPAAAESQANGSQGEEADGPDQVPVVGCPDFSLVTWNVDSASAAPVERMAAVLSDIAGSTPPVDVIFLQEVSRQALRHILGDAHIRQGWYSSESDDRHWRGHPFATLTLLSKRRFGHGEGGGQAAGAKLGPLWRLKYPSRFGRDALCCDVFVAASKTTPSGSGAHARVRFINVHLDSLPIEPSKRPQQMSIVASLLRCTGRGLVAGDFNPVLPEDSTLVADNQLVDAWLHLRENDPGFTWGIDGRAPFPPSRLDKVALLGLVPRTIDLAHPETIYLCSDASGTPGSTTAAAAEEEKEKEESPRAPRAREDDGAVPWSDHSGIKFSFGLVQD
ncbi:hypothetical protein E4U42_000060 [Claviceps africana]|uniref:Endonuclease/exonuclease/phosphatase domain-containing protein n=1 Tax=Claviceps africana TaxID=83212 RepID=A0A8K0J078_9HYPO|nr:hypothetical protein E4U42_000060 [Claviceps africana]